MYIEIARELMAHAHWHTISPLLLLVLSMVKVILPLNHTDAKAPNGHLFIKYEV
jgi:hypothetical protein